MKNRSKTILQSLAVVIGASLFGLAVGALRCADRGHLDSCRLLFASGFAILALCALFIEARK